MVRSPSGSRYASNGLRLGTTGPTPSPMKCSMVGLAPSRSPRRTGALEPLRPRRRRQVPPAVRHLDHPRRLLLRHRRLQHASCRTPPPRATTTSRTTAPLFTRRRQHRRHRRPRQHRDHPHRLRQGPPHLLARRQPRSPTTTRTSTTGDWDDEANPKDQNPADARSLSAAADLPFTGSVNAGTEPPSTERWASTTVTRVGKPDSTVSRMARIPSMSSTASRAARPTHGRSTPSPPSSRSARRSSPPTARRRSPTPRRRAAWRRTAPGARMWGPS